MDVVSSGMAAAVLAVGAIYNFTVSQNPDAGIGFSTGAFWAAVHAGYVWSENKEDDNQ